MSRVHPSGLSLIGVHSRTPRCQASRRAVREREKIQFSLCMSLLPMVAAGLCLSCCYCCCFLTPNGCPNCRSGWSVAGEDRANCLLSPSCASLPSSHSYSYPIEALFISVVESSLSVIWTSSRRKLFYLLVMVQSVRSWMRS